MNQWWLVKRMRLGAIKRSLMMVCKTKVPFQWVHFMRPCNRMPHF